MKNERMGVGLVVVAAALAAGCKAREPCAATEYFHRPTGSCVVRCEFAGPMVPCESDGGILEGGVTGDGASGDGAIACGDGQVRCGSECRDLQTNPSHCGACDRSCPSLAHSEAVCAAASCENRCNPGFQMVGGRCEVGVARLVAPMSGSFVTTTRPTLRWVLPAGADGARIELCVRRPCAEADVVASAVVRGSSAPTPLPMSSTAAVYFWQVRAMVGDVVAARPSALWSFVPRARGSGSDTAIGSLFDFDGDGRGDWAAGAPNAEWMGNSGAGAVGVALTDDAVGAVPIRFGGQAANENVGFVVANAGDVNGDGYSDLLTIALRGGAKVLLYTGGPRESLRVDPVPQALSAPVADKLFGYAFASAGDIDRDGFGDVIVSAPLEDEGTTVRAGAVYLYRGSAAGLVLPPQRFAGSRASGYFGASVASAGDFNGDGYFDIVVGEPNQVLNAGFGPGDGAASVVLGGAAGLDRVGNRWTGGGGNGLFGARVQLLGDVNADGRPDVAVAARNDGRMGYLGGGSVAIYASAGASIPDVPLATLWGDNDRQFFGAVMASGDLNRDGVDDVVVSVSDFDASTTGEVWIFAGGIAGPRARTDRLRSLSVGTGFGAALAVAGPMRATDGDSLFVGQPDSLGGNVERFDAQAAPLTLSAHLGLGITGRFGASVVSSR